MKTILFLALAALAAETVESIKIQDAVSLVRCYAIQPYVLKKTGADLKSEHGIGEAEIQNACSQKAVAYAAQVKSKPDELAKIVEEVRKGHRIEATLPIQKILAENDKTFKACDTSSMFAALKAGLSHPQNYPSAQNSDVQNAYKVIDVCIKDKQFAEDLAANTNATDASLKENLCVYYQSRKIKSNCK